MSDGGRTGRHQRIVLVTGGSRGVGAATAQHLGSAGAHVIITYREKAKRANDVVDSITAAGGSASAVQLDICDPRACTDVIRRITDEFGRLDALILNASGGLERGAAPDYPMRINRDAPVHLLSWALPLIPVGGRVVFVTSHQAHFYGTKPVPKDYIPIAESKRAGEDALRAMRPELTAHGVTLTVVSGDMIHGTIIVRLLHRRDPAAVEARRAHGPLPTLDEFAAAITGAALDPAPAHDTVYVGGADYLDAQTSSPPQLPPVADAVAAYRLLHHRIDELIRRHPHAADLVVPACPDWTVRQTVAHLVGVAQDVICLNLEGKGTDAWAQAQVERLGDHDLDALLELWSQSIDQLADTLAEAPQWSACQLVFDTITHEYDLRGALNEPAGRTSDPAVGPAIGFVTMMVDQFIRHGSMPALRLSTPATGPVQLGDPDAAPGKLALAVSDFEAIRAFGGRRSVAQLLALPWHGDPAHLLPAFTQQLPAVTSNGIRPPTHDLIE
jgi:uncharacterized protein (TIGR03083 family)